MSIRLRPILGMMIMLVVAASCVTTTSKISHKFVATDESGKQLIYVDETNPKNDWTIALPGNRDIQLTDHGTVLVSVPSGYREYSLKDGKLVKEVKSEVGVKSLVRLASGHTLLAGDSGVVELDENDNQVAFLKKDLGRYFRLLRVTKAGSLLYTSGVSTVTEMQPDGNELRTLDLSELTPGTKKPYFIEELPNGQFLIATGYGATILILDKDWKLLRSYGAKDQLGDGKAYFFADSHKLANGDIVVAHWSGHNRKDSEKAPQVIEFDENGKIVWSWHDPKRSGTLHGIEVIE